MDGGLRERLLLIDEKTVASYGFRDLTVGEPSDTLYLSIDRLNGDYYVSRVVSRLWWSDGDFFVEIDKTDGCILPKSCERSA